MKYKLALLVLLSAPAFAAKVYTYKDANGKTVFSDVPPQGVLNIQEKRIGANVIDTSGWPYELQQVIKRAPVVMWGNNCGDICDQGRKLLIERGIPYEMKDPSASKDQFESFKKLTGGNGVPVLQVGGQFVNGFSVDSWNAALSNVGYPKTALKGIQGAPKAAAKAVPATK